MEEVSIQPKTQPPLFVSEKDPGKFNVHDTLRHGFGSAQRDIASSHPLEQVQANYAVNREAVMFQTLRDTQGLCVPLSLQMERKIVSRIQRIAPLESSMVALETLTGNDQTLAVEEILNPPVDLPVSVDGRSIMEKKLKMS